MRRKLAFTLLLVSVCSLMMLQPSAVSSQLESAGSTVSKVNQADWTGFWQTFNMYASWSTEWFDGVSWVNRDSYMQIVKEYPQPNRCKVTLNFAGEEAGDYRFTFAIDKRVRNHVEKTSVWQYELSYEGFTVVFDWSDVKDISGLTLSHGVLNGFFWFRMRRNNVPENWHASLDPSIVASVGSIDATNFSYQRKMFYHNGRFWLFYSTASNIYFRSSTDGDSWSAATSIGAVDAGGISFSLHFNGTYVYYVRDYVDLYYRMGTPNADGSISWSTTEQTAVSLGAAAFFLYPSITVDSDGYAFIAYLNGSTATYVTKSSLNNGTWTTDTGFPFQIKNSLSYIALCGLSTGRIYAVYSSLSGTSLDGRLWDGASWDSEENIGTPDAKKGFSVTNEGDNVHLVYVNTTSSAILYVERVWGVGWSSSVTLATSTVANPVIAVRSSDIYVYWASSDTIYYKIYFNASWRETVEWFTDSFTSDSLNTFYAGIYGGLGVMWTTTTPEVKFQEHANYVFHGLYNEEDGILDVNGVNVTVYFSSGVPWTTFLVNGTYTYYTPLVPLYFKSDLVSDREYWISDEDATGATIYLFNGTLTSYTLNFLDLAGALDDYPFVSGQRYVNGTLRTVEKRRIDAEKKIQMSLVNGAKYNLIIADGSSYTFGDLLMTSITSVTLTLRGIEFPKETLLTSKYVRIYGLRSFNISGTGNITITYQDLLEETNSVEIYIDYRNGTNVYNATETSDSFIHTWTAASNITDYTLECNINHTRYGVYSWKQYYPRVYTANPWSSLAFLGALPFNLNVLLGAFLIIVVGGSFSMVNPEVGAFLATVTAAALTYIGFIQIAPGALITAITFSLMLAIVIKKRRVSYG